MVVARLGRVLHNRRAIDRVLVLIRAITIIVLLVVALGRLILMVMDMMHRWTMEPMRDWGWWLIIISATIALLVVMVMGRRWEENCPMVILL